MRRPTVQVPADARLREVVQALGADGDEVYVTDLAGEKATVVVRKCVSAARTRPTRRERAADLTLAERLAGDVP